MTYVLLMDYNILPKKKLHSSRWVRHLCYQNSETILSTMYPYSGNLNSLTATQLDLPMYLDSQQKSAFWAIVRDVSRLFYILFLNLHTFLAVVVRISMTLRLQVCK